MQQPRGFSLVELAITLGLIAVLAGTLLERMVYYQERAEKASMEQVAADLRSSVNLRAAELVLENRFAELDALVLKNPFDLLAQRPQNYLGVLDAPAAEQVAAGNWYFDKRSKEVVYSIDLGRYFVPNEQGSKRVVWHVVSVPGADKPAVSQWARLELVRPYRWF
ncbi:MAG TPA: type II secretion system protein [Burkholderiales bacterium]|nr:type II secretion system protein [Burkholderiales bacterium]